MSDSGLSENVMASASIARSPETSHLKQSLYRSCIGSSITNEAEFIEKVRAEIEAEIINN